ncbi:MAG: 4Fe-4S dicluster domain-containing protein [Magnetococcales bacterium]|nr:4Fe-4S dicluster domain-containing protein [Magnetococcales bacterium]
MKRDGVSAQDETPPDPKRRRLLKGLGIGVGVGLAAGGGVALKAASAEGTPLGDSLEQLLQDHYQRMTPEEIQRALRRIERQAQRQHGVAIRCENQAPLSNVRFGFALNLSKCVGTRRCIEACLQENNAGRHGNLENIRVVEMPQGSWSLAEGEHYFPAGPVPRADKWYLPVQCHQCDEPPCVQACPVEATWQEPDGIVVIDYDWCIGCRYCAVSCPYWGRHFNWAKPSIPPEQINPETHYLGNRPRDVGVMEKCTFCVQRTRRGEQPACQEACPTGARIFGNLLDPNSEIRAILANKAVFRLKEDLGTHPKFWYFSDG